MAEKHSISLSKYVPHLYRDVLIIFCLFVVSIIVGTQFDVFESVVDFAAKYETIEMDEIISGFLIVSILLMIFSTLKIFELGKTTKMLNEANLKLNDINDKLHIVGQFTRHDAQNKLAIILNNLYLAKIALSKNKDVSKYCQSIQIAVDQIKDLFEFSKVYEQLGVEEFSKIDVGSVIDEASLSLGLGIVRLENKCKGIIVTADQMLMRLFYNLMQNSLRHGEKVTLIKIYPKTIDGLLQIIYEDNGIGILEFEKRPIFVEGHGKGTGYGLFLIKKMCEKYGWKIVEKGKPGIGVKFIMSINSTK